MLRPTLTSTLRFACAFAVTVSAAIAGCDAGAPYAEYAREDLFSVSDGEGNGDDAPACPAGLLACGDRCVDAMVDPSNCGACGNSCAPGKLCDGTGTCKLTCQTGMIVCDSRCTDPMTDRIFCGATETCRGGDAGDVCDAGEICNGSGQCDLSCQPGLLDCDGTCVDPMTDRRYCGATETCSGEQAGTLCGPGEVCNGAGECELSCQPGLVNCNGTCIDPETDRAHCGAAGSCEGEDQGEKCAAGEICNGAGACELSCQKGLIDCDGTCIDPMTDRNHCGAAYDCKAQFEGEACDPGKICDGTGSCELSCQDGLIDCEGTCINPMTDRDHCGASGSCYGDLAGAPCEGNDLCVDGECRAACPEGTSACGGLCVDVDGDEEHCGSCDTVCAVGEVCTGGNCESPW
jgi:hypothetical protein